VDTKNEYANGVFWNISINIKLIPIQQLWRILILAGRCSA